MKSDICKALSRLKSFKPRGKSWLSRMDPWERKRVVAMVAKGESYSSVARRMSRGKRRLTATQVSRFCRQVGVVSTARGGRPPKLR